MVFDTSKAALKRALDAAYSGVVSACRRESVGAGEDGVGLVNGSSWDGWAAPP